MVQGYIGALGVDWIDEFGLGPQLLHLEKRMEVSLSPTKRKVGPCPGCAGLRPVCVVCEFPRPALPRGCARPLSGAPRPPREGKPLSHHVMRGYWGEKAPPLKSPRARCRAQTSRVGRRRGKRGRGAPRGGRTMRRGAASSRLSSRPQCPHHRHHHPPRPRPLARGPSQ